MRNTLSRFRVASAMHVLTGLLAALLVGPGPATASPTGIGSGSGTGTVVQRSSSPQAPGDPFWVLQMNLCNSGRAPCWEMNQGQSVPEAQAMIRAQTPDVVTLNEVCRADVYVLWSTMDQMYPNNTVWPVFQPALDRETNTSIKCDNGDDFGVAVIGRLRFIDDGPTPRQVSGRYSHQDPNLDVNEMRVFTCLIGDELIACTTHLASGDKDIAMEQCHELMDINLPYIRSLNPRKPVVVGGDFNLKRGPIFEPDIGDCIPDGWDRRGDGSVQHVLFPSSDYESLGVEILEMEHTDHPALAVHLSRK